MQFPYQQPINNRPLMDNMDFSVNNFIPSNNRYPIGSIQNIHTNRNHINNARLNNIFVDQRNEKD